jgi:LysM repeat protein
MNRIRILILVSFYIFVLVFPTFGQETDDATHTIQAGENLFRIALRYGIDMNELAAVNGITNPSHIYVGQVLIIPGLSAPDSGYVIENPLIAATPIIHRVQRGEYLQVIAVAYGVTVEEIAQANQMGIYDTIYPGQELQIWTSDISTDEIVEPESISEVEATPEAMNEVEATQEPELSNDDRVAIEIAATETPSITHIVAPGEYLSQIARRYNVTWTTIAEANQITNPNHIYAGMAIIIPNGTPEVLQSYATAPTLPQDLLEPGAHWGEGREIVVDLSTQMTYVYDDGELVFKALVSTGLPYTPTVQGEYAIWYRLPAQTMSGPGYYLPNVQWVQYFYSGYGFHGTYWHDNFGNPMSHGCVNMTNDDAEWLYNFADIGTNVYVQY